METILTIDFDIIMGPSIELYNTQIGPLIFEDIVKKAPLLEYANADLNTYNFLTRKILELFTLLPENKVHFILKHDTIIQFLNENCLYKVINIDHHHDLGYGDNIDKQPITCGNWVNYLLQKNMLSSYIWYHNGNSDLMYKKNNIIKDYILDELYEVNLTEVNEVFICLSPEWIPNNYINLYIVWGILYEFFYKQNQFVFEENKHENRILK